jgi:hypothetical protein
MSVLPNQNPMDSSSPLDTVTQFISFALGIANFYYQLMTFSVVGLPSFFTPLFWVISLIWLFLFFDIFGQLVGRIIGAMLHG